MERRRRWATGRFPRFLVGAAFLPLVLLVLGATVGSEPARAAETMVRVGGSLSIPPDQVVDGDVFVVGGPVSIAGRVRGDAVAIGGAVDVTGSVEQDVVAVGGTITLRSTARVGGDVVAVGGHIVREPGSVVAGEISSIALDPRVALRFPRYVWHYSWHYPPSGWASLFYVAGLFVFALLVTAFFPDSVETVAAAMERDAARSVIIGMITLLAVVPLTLVLLVTIVGPLFLWIAFFAAKMLGYVAAVHVIGRRVGRAFSGGVPPRLVLATALGVASIALLRHIPVFGPLFSAFLTAWSLGAAVDTKFGTNRPWLPPRRP